MKSGSSACIPPGCSRHAYRFQENDSALYWIIPLKAWNGRSLFRDKWCTRPPRQIYWSLLPSLEEMSPGNKSKGTSKDIFDSILVHFSLDHAVRWSVHETFLDIVSPLIAHCWWALFSIKLCMGILKSVNDNIAKNTRHLSMKVPSYRPFTSLSFLSEDRRRFHHHICYGFLLQIFYIEGF